MALSPLRAGRERRTAVALLVAGVFALSAVLAYAEDGNSVGVDGAPSSSSFPNSSRISKRAFPISTSHPGERRCH